MENIFITDAVTPSVCDRALGMSAARSWLVDPAAAATATGMRHTSVRDLGPVRVPSLDGRGGYAAIPNHDAPSLTNTGNDAAAAKQASPPRGEPR